MPSNDIKSPGGEGWSFSETKNGPLRYNISWTMIAKL